MNEQKPETKPAEPTAPMPTISTIPKGALVGGRVHPFTRKKIRAPKKPRHRGS